MVAYLIPQGYPIGSVSYFLWEYDFKHSGVDKPTDRLPIDESLAIRARVVALVDQQGLTVAELTRRLLMTSGGFYKMWNNGTITAARLVAIARILNVSVAQLLGRAADDPVASPIVSEPDAPAYGRPRFLEERIAYLETEVRKLKEQTRTR